MTPKRWWPDCAKVSTGSPSGSASRSPSTKAASGEIIVDTFGIDVWFCDPHSPWQRGQIENQNRQIRWWYPRGIDLSLVTPDHADSVADLINNQRRRSLGYQSLATIYHHLSVH